MVRILPVLVILLLCFTVLANKTNAQGSITKKVTILVTDAATGKPVEGAEVKFKALIGKLVKKTNAEGKAVFDMLVATGGTLNWKYTITYPNTSTTYKPFSGEIKLTSGQDVYDYTASMQPDVKKVSFKIADDKRQPLTDAVVKLKDDNGNEFTSKSDANGVAGFDLPPGANYRNATLTIVKNGFNDYTVPVEVNEQTSQVAIVAQLSSTVMIVDGTGGISKPENKQFEPTTNLTPTAMPPGYYPIPKNPNPVWGPYKPECDENPLASVPTYTPLSVEDEKTLLDNISSSCLGAAGEAVNSLVDVTENIIGVSSKLTAVWSQAFQNKQPSQIIQATQKMYDDTKKITEEERDKTKKAVDDAVEKTKELLDKMKELAAGPEMYAISCMWDGMKDYAIPEDLAKLKKSTETFDKAKTAMQEKLEAMEKRVLSGESLKWADKELFTDWKDVKENVGKTTSGLNLIVSYISNPKKILPYETQINLSISTAEKLMGTLLTDCQVRECDRQISQGITVGQASLTAARKYAAQMKKGESKWREIINDYVYKNFKPEDRGWEHYGKDDFRRELLPQGAYGSWINYHNEAIVAEKEVPKFETLLRRLSELCKKIQPLAATLNERVNKYETIYSKGLIAVENCKLDEAAVYIKELQSLENGECGHFFPKPFGKTKSEELDIKIKAAKQTGKCKTEKGVYTLKEVIVQESNQYYKLSETEFLYHSAKGDLVFTLQTRPPAALNPKQTFTVDMAAKTHDPTPIMEYQSMFKWTSNTGERIFGAADKFVIVGNYESKIVPAANGTLKITVPEFTGTEIILHVEVGSAGGRSVYDWLKFVYVRTN